VRRAESAGLEPGKLNPVVVEAMKDAGIDISGHRTKSVQDMVQARRQFDYIITVCDEASAERCPAFPGNGKRLHMGFPDPSAFKGNHEEILEQTKNIRDKIRDYLENWVHTVDHE